MLGVVEPYVAIRLYDNACLIFVDNLLANSTPH